MGILVRLAIKTAAKVARIDLTDPAHPIHDVVRWIVGG